MRIPFDSNIMVSAVVYPTARTAHFVEVAKQHGIVLTSEYVLAELDNVVGRKYSDRAISMSDFIDFVIDDILHDTNDVDSEDTSMIGDPKDKPMLAAAIRYGVDILITGDKHFRGFEVPGIKVMTMAEFVAEFGATADPDLFDPDN